MRRSEREFREKDALRMAAATDYARNPYKVGAFDRLDKAEDGWEDALDELLLEVYMDGFRRGTSTHSSA